MAKVMTRDGIRNKCPSCGRIFPDSELNKGKYRCKKCRRAYVARWREKVKVEMEADPNHPKHGTSTGYQAGCRCPRCKAKGRLDNARNRERRRRECLPA